MKIIRLTTLALILCAATFSAYSQDTENKEQMKVSSSVEVLKEFTTMKENIPSQLLKITEGMIIIPGMKNASFVIGGKRGKGVAVVKNADGTWSDPVFVTITGGSFGLQAGLQSIDLILVFKKKSTLENIDKGDFTIGGNVSATAGPVGRSSSASTDYKMEAEVYSYSRSKGLFAGISLDGSAIEIDDKANERYYGEEVSAKEIFSNEANNNHAETSALKNELQTVAVRK